jgi:5'-AMP-activated protein kinase catalytic alpha subunit/MAP/microtubule affinity-regulating kinase
VQACKFLHQIIDGVELLHMNEITHRDLKPEVHALFACSFLSDIPFPLPCQNLLLKASPDGWLVKIVDFGLSNTHEVCSFLIMRKSSVILFYLLLRATSCCRLPAALRATQPPR